ncbi:MAG TPA: hypothetical protein VGM88_01390 [Kofleriaceae bacterium]|jgi:Spy/CpxP family protein refolding chaperone
MRAVRRWLACAVVATSLGTAASAMAQPRRGGGDATARREQIKEKIRMMRAGELTVALGLTPASSERLFPLLAHYDDETDRLVEKRQDLNRRLRSVDGMDPRAIEALIDESAANQRAFADLEQRRIADLRKVLTPVQVAKTLVVLPAFETKIRKQIMNALTKAQARGRGPAPDDDDDDRESDESGPPPPPPPRPKKGGPAPCDPYASSHGRC